MSKNYIKDLYKIWDKQEKKSGLIYTTFRANIFSIIWMVILSAFVAGLEIISISLFREYIKMFGKDVKPMFDLTKTQIGIIFLSVKFFSTFVSRQTAMIQNNIGYQSSIELNCLIYKKVLNSSPASFKEKSKEGEIINFLQVDSAKLAMTMIYTPGILVIPIQIVVYTYMLWQYFGISFIFGFITLAVFIGMNFFIQNKYRLLQKDVLQKKDSRMKITTEVFNGLKVLKLYAWEDEFLNRIKKARENELAVLRRIFGYSVLNLTLLWIAPVATSVASIGAYQYFSSELVVEDIFSCLAIFNAIQEPIRTLPWTISNLLEVLISMKRIEKYLQQDEVDPSRIIINEEDTISKDISIKIENGNFSWGVEIQNESEKETLNKISENTKLLDSDQEEKYNNKNMKSFNSSKPGDKNINRSYNKDNINSIDDSLRSEKYDIIVESNNQSIEMTPENVKIVLKNINLEIKKGEFVCIIGEVGSGKSSLLQAMLNNMKIVNETTDKQTKIILNGKVSYVSQIPWIQNDTVKNNIIFHSDYDENKYKYILEICELKQDLEVLVGGDMTEIGEKGINLSGGQKARISMARALYADSDIYIFDDPISALDAHVGQNIMKNCISLYLENKTRVLVTHALQYLNFSDRIIYMNNGQVLWQGNYTELITQPFFTDFTLKLQKSNSSMLTQSTTIINSDDKEQNKQKEKETTEIKRITKDEDKEEGKVKIEVYFTYLKYMGGYFMFFFVIINVVLWQILKGGADFRLTYWTKHQSKENNLYYFWEYAALGLSSSIFTSLRVYLLSRGSLSCAKRLHTEMIDKLVRAPINLFHDTIPKGQILNRLSKDLTNIDVYTMFMYGSVIIYFFAFIGAIIICSFVEPFCLIFLPILMIFGLIITRFFINCSRELSRLDGIIRSPIVNLLAETIPGAITIRAFRLEDNYMDKFHSRADEYYKIRLILAGVSQWFGLILDLLTVTFMIFLVIITLLYQDEFQPEEIGIVLMYSMVLQDNLIRFLNVLSSFENCMVSMERCLKYTKIPTELPYELPDDEKLNQWPQQGKIQFIDYSVKYRPETELVLKNLNFTINPKEKIGVVGRTGSGKSTLCLSLFRILEATKGKILIDGVDIADIGLKKLRSNLTIIPQDPNLMEGSLRNNIDPLNLYTEEEIKEVMQMIGFWYICENDSKGLEQFISDGGSNLSVGEKQLICISRAILRVH